MLSKVQIMNEDDDEYQSQTEGGERDSIDEHNFAKAKARYDDNQSLFPGVKASDQLKEEVWGTETTTSNFFIKAIEQGNSKNNAAAALSSQMQKNKEAIDQAVDGQIRVLPLMVGDQVTTGIINPRPDPVIS